MRLTLLTTDVFMLGLLVAGAIYAALAYRSAPLRATWRLVFQRPAGLASAIILSLFVGIALVDSVHIRLAIQTPEGQPQRYAEPMSLLDFALKPLVEARERSYSAPLAIRGFRKESFERNGHPVRDFPPLKFGGRHLPHEDAHVEDVRAKSLSALAQGLAAVLVMLVVGLSLATWQSGRSPRDVITTFLLGRTQWPWRTAFITVSCVILVSFFVACLSRGYHVFGTDQTGVSILVIALKSIRTALVIGSLTTLVVLPIGVFLGVMAGALRGWVDEVIQYVYTLLASIPDVLLIAASVLLLQAFIDANPQLFQTALERSDARLLFLCIILGVTSFTGLCRLVRGEAMKLRELEYVQAARSAGVSTVRILFHHITPNLMHIVLISVVMQFSGFILAEAVLSYVGIGVDPKTASFGILINSARSELAASPVVWWTLTTAFVFMLALVLSANLLADAIRDAFDPRTRLRSSAE